MQPGCAPTWRTQRLPFGGPQEPPGILWVVAQAESSQGSSRATQEIPALPGCWVVSADCDSGGTVSSAGLAQSRPESAKTKISWASTGLLGYQHSSHVSGRDLKSLGNAKMDLAGFGKGRGTAPAALWGNDSCLGCKKPRKPACAGRPLRSHHSSSFLLHGLIVPELQILPKECPLPILLCWLAGSTLFLCSLSEQQQQLLSPCSLSKSA